MDGSIRLEKVGKCNMLKAVLNACASIVALEVASCVHHQIIECGWDSDVYVVNSLVDMYAKRGSMEDAWRVFNKMPSQNMVTWTAVIVGHVKCGDGQKALELFQQMQHEVCDQTLLLLWGY
jgi:pentatricopeptide repeat protein